MKIISDPKYRDYYDGLQDYADNDLIYIRKPNKKFVTYKEIGFKEKLITKEKGWRYTSEIIDTPERFLTTNPINVQSSGYQLKDVGIVFFCGKAYPYIATIHKTDPYAIEEIITYSYNIEFCKFLFSTFRKSTYSRIFGVESDLKYMDNFFNQYSKEDFTWLHLFLKSPVFVLQHKKFAHGNISIYSNINSDFNDANKRDKEIVIYDYPVLKAIEFSKVMDSYQTYQNIDRFLSNELSKEKIPDPTNTEEKFRMKSRFGGKYSFRKEPEIKKKK